MALSKIWSAFIITAIIVALSRMLFFDAGTNMFNKMVVGKHGDTTHTKIVDSSTLNNTIILAIQQHHIYKNGETVYTKNKEGKYISYQEQGADGILATCTVAVNICIGLIGIMALFMGLLAIAEQAGAINLLSKIIGPFFNKLFPELPKNHPAYGHMILNFSANLLNMDNAATPFGLKAMQSLQEINPDKEKASNAQVMFLCLHASGLTLIPITIIAFRAELGAANPTDIFIPCMIATFAATMAAMLIVSFKQKINVLQPVILLWVLGISAVIAALVLYIRTLSKEGVDVFSGLLSNGLILFIFLVIIAGGLFKKINVFDAFVEGAKGGFETAIKIIPYLVGMLVAISMLRTSGSFDAVINAMKYIFVSIGMDTRFVDGLPTALVKPMSGSAARGMMIDTMKFFGADSYAGRLSSILQGSSDTTFYVVAVYFGAVGIKNTRYTIGAMLLADLVGIITAILLSYMFFG